MSDHILIEKSGGVLTLTMNRPDKKNALTRAMYQSLGDAIDQAAFDKDVRCILIQANGDMFTAGNDLADFAAVNAGEANAKITAPSAGSTVTGESITVKGSYWATASVKEVRVSLCTLDAKGL